jgi:hypothetical protein
MIRRLGIGIGIGRGRGTGAATGCFGGPDESGQRQRVVACPFGHGVCSCHVVAGEVLPGGALPIVAGQLL